MACRKKSQIQKIKDDKIVPSKKYLSSYFEEKWKIK
jgi:hypothetical protein